MEHEYHIQLIHQKNDYVWKHHISSSYRVVYLMEGQCVVGCNDHRFMMPSDTVLLIPPGSHYTLTFSKTTKKMKAYLCVFHPSLPLRFSTSDCDLSACFKNLEHFCMIRPGSDITVVMISLLKRLIHLKSDTKYGREIYQDSCLALLFVLLNRGFLEDFTACPPSAASLPMNEVCHFLIEHLGEDLSLESIADYFYMNKFTLSRKFKEKTGLTIYQYLKARRLDLCKELLEQGLSVKDIYHRCGFQDYNHLFRVFKKEFGITPKGYYKKTALDRLFRVPTNQD